MMKHKIGDIIETRLATTGFCKVVGVNTEDRNQFIKESCWDYILQEFNPLKPNDTYHSVRVLEGEIV